MFIRLLSALCLGLFLSTASHAEAAYQEREDVLEFVEEMVSEHGLDRDWLISVFADVERRDSVLEAIASPAEGLPWYRYRSIFMTRERIEGGADFWETHAETLQRAEEEFGVDAAMLVAIIGIETYYGRHQGTHPVLDSLVTLGFDYPPRARFFRSELAHLFQLADEENLDIHELKGSYAGAMGAGQFISSSYRAYAVDFSGSGQRDLFNDWEDAIGSVANYFSEHGWEHGQPVVLPALVPDDQDMEKPEPLGRKPASALREKGLVFSQSVADDKSVLPVRLERENGEDWWVGLNNFWAITRYNHSPLYAMAAWELSQAIEQEYQQRD